VAGAISKLDFYFKLIFLGRTAFGSEAMKIEVFAFEVSYVSFEFLEFLPGLPG
jgi:hypothetical protein